MFDCVVQKNIHTYPKEGYLDFQGGGKPRRPEFLKYEPKLEFPEGWMVQATKPSMGGVWVFSGTTHSNKHTVSNNKV